MGKPLDGIKVVEVATWAFVPAAGAILADMGATVIKVEPTSGDPLRGLQTELGRGGDSTINLSWEAYNRGKQSITLDLRQRVGLEILYRLLEDADVFLSNLLPPARRQIGIDADTIRARFPNLIYATGSALGQQGRNANQGGYDAITFWARGGVCSSLTEEDAEHPVGPPGPAFGDTLSGSMLAGGICAAIAQRAMTGVASSVDVSLLGAAMWSMQRTIAEATERGIPRISRPARDQPNNVLVNNYRTSDGRFVALCMLQADKYWAKFCAAAGRPELAADLRFIDATARRQNLKACVTELKALFASKSLVQWRQILGRQDGQWDVVQHVGEIAADGQVQANQYLQTVPVSGGRTIPMVSVPMQFDGAPLATRGSPELGADSDAILSGLGYDEDAIIELKVAGVVL